MAGLALNIGEAVLHGVVLADPTAQAMTALGRLGELCPGLALLIGITFVQGLVGLWLYALLSARGVTRARALRSLAGFVLWVTSAVYSAVYFGAGFPGVMPAAVIWWPVVWGAVEFPLAIFVWSGRVQGAR